MECARMDLEIELVAGSSADMVAAKDAISRLYQARLAMTQGRMDDCHDILRDTTQLLDEHVLGIDRRFYAILEEQYARDKWADDQAWDMKRERETRASYGEED
jgi:hypothetical protein